MPDQTPRGRLVFCSWVLIVLFLAALPVAAQEETTRKDKTYPEHAWGLGFAFRTALTPYNPGDDWIGSLFPLLYFDHPRFFLDGLEGGIKLFARDRVRLDFLGRMRFVDVPEEYEDRIDDGAFDFGPRLRYELRPGLFAGLELLTDGEFRWQANLGLEQELEYNCLALAPFLNLRLKSREYNNYYIGLDRADLGQGVDISWGLEGRLRVWQNLFLLGRYSTTWITDDLSGQNHLDRNLVHEFYLGLGLMSLEPEKRKKSLGISPYLRVAHGLATPSDLGEILTGKGERDRYSNQLSSLFFGYPLTDRVFGLPLELYLTLGFVWHWSSDVQPHSQEYVAAIKAYLTFKWPIRWRLGIAEGVSYASRVPYIEQEEMDRKGYDPCKLMNYLDFSVDLNLGDIIPYEPLKSIYLGYAIHHRSALFEASSQYGRIKGGSNYHTIYLQYHF